VRSGFPSGIANLDIPAAILQEKVVGRLSCEGMGHPIFPFAIAGGMTIFSQQINGTVKE